MIIKYPTVELETEYGNIEIIVDGHNTVKIVFPHLMIDGVWYKGSWVAEDTGTGFYSKTDKYGYGGTSLSIVQHYLPNTYLHHPTKSKIINTLQDIVNKWAKDNNDMFIMANRINKGKAIINLITLQNKCAEKIKFILESNDEPLKPEHEIVK